MWHANQLRKNIEQDRRGRGTCTIVYARLASPDFIGLCHAMALSHSYGCVSAYLFLVRNVRSERRPHT